MKRIPRNRFYFLILPVSLFFLLNCSSTKNTSNSSNNNPPEIVDNGYEQVLAKNSNQSNSELNPNQDRKSNMSLGDMIRRLPGVQVSGQGQNLRVKVNGSESFMSNTDPLYVLNGVAVGTDYAQIANTINPNDITSLNVLKGPNATIYGTRGANGVILIRTK